MIMGAWKCAQILRGLKSARGGHWNLGISMGHPEGDHYPVKGSKGGAGSLVIFLRESALVLHLGSCGYIFQGFPMV